jgi:hypothetical protein
MPLYTFLHSLLNALVQIANKMGLENMKTKKNIKMNAREAYRKIEAKGKCFQISSPHCA